MRVLLNFITFVLCIRLPGFFTGKCVTQDYMCALFPSPCKKPQKPRANNTGNKIESNSKFERYKLLNQNFKAMSEVSSKVTEIIVDKLGVDAAEVVPAASFTNDLGADSLDTVELIMEFEKEFGISIPDEDAEKITTVGDAITYIEAKK